MGQASPKMPILGNLAIDYVHCRIVLFLLLLSTG